MCGILAALSRSERLARDFEPILQDLAHRGPDDEAHALLSLTAPDVQPHDRAWLGHRRLAILDLSQRGRQPMATADGRFVIIFNGEIYNYVELRRTLAAGGVAFSTDTDTEVLLQAWATWGEAGLGRLKGMFAFVVVDRLAGTAALVRDFFGIKPLYYADAGDAVFACSEILPLLRSGGITADLDGPVAFEYLRFGATASPERTILRDVRALPPAHLAVFDFRTGQLSAPRPYWTLESRPRAITFPDAVAECRERFLDNVRLHLRSDVPVGAALSGGIDSSAIVCAMRRLEPDLELQTFSFIPDDPARSEERWVDLVHQTVGGRNHKIRTAPEDLSAEIAALVRHQGEPFVSASVFAQYRVFARARAEGVPVTLDGQGADELLGGYWPFVATAAATRIRRADLIAATRLVLGATQGAAESARLAAMVVRALLPPGARQLGQRIAGRQLVPDYLDRGWLGALAVDPVAVSLRHIGDYRSLAAHLIDSVLRGSLPGLLRYADRNAMAFSVESRVPFLTHDFAEFLISLPPSFIISPSGDRKRVFREAMQDIIPEPIRARRDKIGFVADDARLLRANRQPFAAAFAELDAADPFDGRRFRKYLDGFWAGDDTRAPLVWRALVFAYWRREVASTLARRVA